MQLVLMACLIVVWTLIFIGLAIAQHVQHQEIIKNREEIIKLKSIVNGKATEKTEKGEAESPANPETG